MTNISTISCDTCPIEQYFPRQFQRCESAIGSFGCGFALANAQHEANNRFNISRGKVLDGVLTSAAGAQSLIESVKQQLDSIEAAQEEIRL